MLRHIGRRLLALVPVAVGVSLLTFALVHLLPGDPALVMLGESGGPPERIAEVRAQLGLDAPLVVQYARFVGGALRGDLGRSVRTNQPVLDEIRPQARSTLQLALAGLALALVLGTTLGALAAARRGSVIDRAIVTLSLLGVSTPAFWLGMLLIFLFSLRLGWLPATGQGGLARLALPALTMGVHAMAAIALVTRATVAEALVQAHVTTARAKGVSEHSLLLRHACRNALAPVITLAGLQFGALLGGSVIVESVFARQGLGRLAVEAILHRDVPIVQGLVLVSAAVYTLANLVADIAAAGLDPRLRHE